MYWVVRPQDPPPDPAAPDAIISLGSSHSAYAVEPGWIERHRLLLRAALAAETPVLGVCFGAQALALAGGGEVVPAARPEVGWVDYYPTNRQLVHNRYIVAAKGRDYSDVPPLKGVIFTNGTKHELEVSVDVVRRNQR